jgi:hypothetical protein
MVASRTARLSGHAIMEGEEGREIGTQGGRRSDKEAGMSHGEAAGGLVLTHTHRVAQLNTAVLGERTWGGGG